MLIQGYEIGYYLELIRAKHYFAFVGYSDAEWYCMMRKRIGCKTGLGQLLDAKHGLLLLDVMKRRHKDPDFMFAVPKCLPELPEFCRNQLDYYLKRKRLDIVAYERDMVTDDLARSAGLYPLIKELQNNSVVMIGNIDIKRATFLNYKYYVTISSPNLHMEPDGINNAVNSALTYGQPGVYLVSAGLSAAVIIDRLYGKIKNSFFIDCGSMWDAFVGIGGQREWRADLYATPAKWHSWIDKNLNGCV